MPTWRRSEVKTPANRGPTVRRGTSLPPERRAPSASSYDEWRGRKRLEATAAREAAAEATSPDAAKREAEEERQQRIDALREARERHRTELERRQKHSRDHDRAVRQLEGREHDGRDSVPHYVAMQSAIAEQERDRRDLLGRQRTLTRERRNTERAAFLKSAPEGEAARVDALVADPHASALARYLTRIGHVPTVARSRALASRQSQWTVVEAEEQRREGDDDEGRLSVESDRCAGSSGATSDASDDDDAGDDVPDPGWADEEGDHPAADGDDARPGTSESIRRRTEAMSPEQRERAARAAADAAAEFSAPDP